MSEESQGNHLHLPSLSIAGFRGIDSLTIERLGRVTLLAGKNSVGKTTVLDAVRVYAGRAQRAVLTEILEEKEEVATLMDSGGGKGFGACLEAIFNGRDASDGALLSIGAKDGTNQLAVEAVESDSPVRWGRSLDLPAWTLNIAFKGWKLTGPAFCPYALSTKTTRSRLVYQSTGWPSGDPLDEVTCRAIGPGLLSDHEVLDRWDVIALTEEEDRMVKALQPILGDPLMRIAIIGDEQHHRRVVAKFQDQPFPVPLKSLGDGAMRVFGLALALVNSRDGFLLIDEAENGIHHSVQRDLWRMVLQAAEANNVQVLATTHSFDCVRGFAQAATDFPDIEGALIRLERKNGEMWAVEYSESDLKIAAEQSIEVR